MTRQVRKHFGLSIKKNTSPFQHSLYQKVLGHPSLVSEFRCSSVLLQRRRTNGHPSKWQPVSLLNYYRQEMGTASSYWQQKSHEVRRRQAVCSAFSGKGARGHLSQIVEACG